MDYNISQSQLIGTLQIPPSKSVAHRAIICACLSGGVCHIKNLAFNQDILATISGMQACGFDIEILSDSIITKGRKIEKVNNPKIDCNESGSTLRFLVPIVMMVANGIANFVGQGKLSQRPLDAYYKIFDKRKIYYFNKSKRGKLDLDVDCSLEGGRFDIVGNVSSQYLSGLLMALPLANKDSEINVTSKLESVGYVDLTLKAMKDFGVNIINENYQRFVIKGGQSYTAVDEYYIEGDYSQAAFFAVANHLGSQVQMTGLDKDSLQGDRVIFDMLQKIHDADDNQELLFDGKDCPDIIPIFCVACALRNGKTKIVNVERLRIKECDRIKAVCTSLNALGAKLEQGQDYIYVTGCDDFEGGCSVDCFNDHRIAMLLAIAALRCKKPIRLVGCECVKKSYPNFFDDYVGLGGKVI